MVSAARATPSVGAGASAISATVLLVAEPFAALSAERVARALSAGLSDGERSLAIDTVVVEEPPGEVRAWWRAEVPPERLRAARALVIACARLEDRTLAASVAFEAATSARQAGVPVYAVTGANALDPFEARMLDLQTVLEAGSAQALRSAGRQLTQML